MPYIEEGNTIDQFCHIRITPLFYKIYGQKFKLNKRSALLSKHQFGFKKVISAEAQILKILLEKR